MRKIKSYEVHLSLENGQNYLFFKNAVSKKQIIDEITNEHSQMWYHFISKDYVKNQIRKDQVVSIGISLNKEEAQEFESTLNY